MRKNRGIRRFGFLILGLLFLCACHGNADSADTEDLQPGAAAAPAIDWRSVDFAVSDDVQCTPTLKNGVQITRLPEGRIVRDGRLLCMDWSDSFELSVFEDGTDSMQKAAAFLERCPASPGADSKIVNILQEELGGMYSGSYTPERTAEILNNRIRLYLKETE